MSKKSSSPILDRIRDRIAVLVADAQEMNVSAFQHAFDRNRISRMSPLRNHRPVCPMPHGAKLLTRRADVLEVLEDATRFATVYADKLPGPYVLGARGAEHKAQRDTLEAALALDGPAGLRARIDGDVTDAAKKIVERGRNAGHLDVGADLVHPLLAQVLENFLGVPPPPHDNMWFWARDVFADIFLNLNDLPAVHERGVAATAQLRAYMTKVVDGGGHSGTVLERLVQAREGGKVEWLAEKDVLVVAMIGLAIGWLWHGARAALTAVDELLDRPEAMAQAREAAQAGQHVRLAGVLMEVLRFRPVQPFLVRRAVTDTVIAAGTERATFVKAGTTLLAGTHSAMWDEREVPCPARFDATRLDDDYVIFGRGAHRCQGEQINHVLLPAMLAPLLAAGKLERRSRLVWDGPRPDDLRVVVGS